MEKEIIIKVFKSWVEGMKSIRPEKEISPRDFDCWIGGYIAGFSLGKEGISPETVKEVVDQVVFSEEIKSIGVTGTKSETITLKKYK